MKPKFHELVEYSVVVTWKGHPIEFFTMKRSLWALKSCIWSLLEKW